MMNWLDSGSIIVGGFSLADIGILIYLIRVVIRPVAQTAAAAVEGMKELYASRNQHENRLVAIETLHTVKGCGDPHRDCAGK